MYGKKNIKERNVKTNKTKRMERIKSQMMMRLDF